MDKILFIIALFFSVASYAVAPVVTTDQGQAAIENVAPKNIYASPILGVYNSNTLLPVAVDANGYLLMTSGGPNSNVNVHDGSGTAITSTVVSTHTGLDVNVINPSGMSTVNQGSPNTIGNAWPVLITNGTNTVNVTASGAFQVDGSGVVQPVSQSGSWTVATTLQTASTATITAVSTVTGSSVPLLPTNSSRKGLILFNQSAGFPCYVAFSNTSSSALFTFQLVQGGSYHMDSGTIYQGPISAYCNTGTILVTEM